MLLFYRFFSSAFSFIFPLILKRRLKKGKEDLQRVLERKGKPGLKRPEGKLLWFHAASVGEAQSTLIVINKLLDLYQDIHILVTTGTVTSAELMDKKLPKRAFHQYYPMDHPKWTKDFVQYWEPSGIIWMESELWPNMLLHIQKSEIPCVLLNGRLSKKSYKKWKRFRGSAYKLLKTFEICICQTEEDLQRFQKLGHTNLAVQENIKYAASALSYEEADFKKLKNSIKDRPIWLAASTHQAEEEICCRIHLNLKKEHPNLLTIIVPRHPDRRDSIQKLGDKYNVKMVMRRSNKQLPAEDTDVYVVDTIGELGLFYKLSSIGFIGRSLSDDGGGGHNPIEAAQLNTAILHGPNIQNLDKIYTDFMQASASMEVRDEDDLYAKLSRLLKDEEGVSALQNKSQAFVVEKARVLDKIIGNIEPVTARITELTEQEKAA